MLKIAFICMMGIALSGSVNAEGTEGKSYPQAGENAKKGTSTWYLKDEESAAKGQRYPQAEKDSTKGTSTWYLKKEGTESKYPKTGESATKGTSTWK